jgi:hypothetical protein
MPLPDRELKKGSAELLILWLLNDPPRHGYEIGQLIELRLGGALRFNVASLYPLLYRLEKRGWLRGRWAEKAGTTPPSLLSADWRGRKDPGSSTPGLARIRGSHRTDHRN